MNGTVKCGDVIAESALRDVGQFNSRPSTVLRYALAASKKLWSGKARDAVNSAMVNPILANGRTTHVGSCSHVNVSRRLGGTNRARRRAARARRTGHIAFLTRQVTSSAGDGSGARTRRGLRRAHRQAGIDRSAPRHYREAQRHRLDPTGSAPLNIGAKEGSFPLALAARAVGWPRRSNGSS